MKYTLTSRTDRISYFYLYFLNVVKPEKIYNNFDFTDGEISTIENIISNKKKVLEVFKEKLLTKSNKLSLLEQAVIFNGIAEIILFNNSKIPVINESVKFCQHYCDKNSYKLINGILDNIKNV